MKIFGYRGYSGKYPENTLLAFQKAIEAGAEGIQLDVHFSRDHKVVIIHDEALSRTLDAVGFVRHHVLEELKTYEVKGHYEGPRQYIITLQEYFDWIGDLPVFTCITLRNDRTYYPGLEEELAKIVLDNEMQDRVIISSKRSNSVSFINERWPNLSLAWSVDNITDQAIDKLVEMNCKAVITKASSLNESIVETLHEKEISVIASNVNTEQDAEEMKELDIDGVFTMFIEKTMKILGVDKAVYSKEQIKEVSKIQQVEDGEKNEIQQRIKKKTQFLQGGMLGILLSMVISIAGAVIVTNLVIHFLRSIF